MKDITYIKNIMKTYPELFFSNAFIEDVANLLETQYAGREYHNLMHIRNCLECFKKIESNLETTEHKLLLCEQERIVCAILFHDIIYGANEQLSDEVLSANMFEDFFTQYIKNSDLISSVRELIVSTEHLKDGFRPTYVTQKLIDLMSDIDLSILASSEEVYEEYANKVRNEYSEYNNEDYARGRIKVLFGLTKKAESNILFKSEMFKEANAKALNNMLKEMTVLNTLYLEKKEHKRHL